MTVVTLQWFGCYEEAPQIDSGPTTEDGAEIEG